MKYPCASNPSICTLHQKYHLNKLTQDYSQPSTETCLITTLATETLQQISSYLDVVGEASFVLTCKAISCAVGVKSWDDLSGCGRGKGNSFGLREMVRRKEERMKFLRLLEKDDVRFLCCAVCGILHYADVEDMKSSMGCELGWSGSGKAAKKNDEALSFCDGAYILEPDFVRLAIQGYDRDGVCPQLLACEGKHVFSVARKKSLDKDEDEEIQEPLAVTDVLAHEASEKSGKVERQEHSWTHATISKPRGGGLKTRMNRVWCRIREVRTTVQGHEWYFYFPMTLLCLLPRSRPYWVRQDDLSDTSADNGRKEVKSRRKFMIPWIRKKKPDEQNTAQEAGSGSESGEDDAYTIDGLEDDDTTGWKGYYHDLEYPHPVSFTTKDGAVVPQFRQTKLFCVYEDTKEGRMPWYDTPKNKERLAWCNHKKHKWAEE
jgi:hypothetical protein